MASWNSIPLHVLYEVLGWFAFVCWSISFYPQVILNFRRKSVVGLNFDFVVLNLTKHSAYLLYNASLYFSSTIQKQYKEKYGQHERGNQKVSKIACGIVTVAWSIAAICFFIALPKHHWLWLLSIFSGIQVCMTIIKYIPQAVMNFMRKCTEGWSIGNILLDFSGGVGNYGQMFVQSIDQGSWANFSGNIGKLMISLVSVSFDILFMIQHYLLYRHKKGSNSNAPPEVEISSKQSSDKLVAENV
ncbi:cystinosin homolog isoform X2 [Prosopis cineraria]|uniref:cystinosin homolog isoform X2 n=1 Tax=Prosopis cineraria TaxID=364024 RepID=UPI0024108B92|nr:cystinosin homolog isoform X2 [Prosopis cineraria]